MLLHYQVCVVPLAFDKQKLSDKVNNLFGTFWAGSCSIYDSPQWQLAAPLCRLDRLLTRWNASNNSSFTLLLLVTSKVHYLFVMTCGNTVAKCLAKYLWCCYDWEWFIAELALVDLSGKNVAKGQLTCFSVNPYQERLIILLTHPVLPAQDSTPSLQNLCLSVVIFSDNYP